MESIRFKAMEATLNRQIQTIKEILEHIESIQDFISCMVDERKRANKLQDEEEKAIAYNEKVMPFFGQICYHTDKLELLVDDKLWPLPKYREMMFMK